MFRTHSFIALAIVSLASMFATGCIAESNEPSDLIWYDDEFDACLTSGKDGKTVEVPCEEAAMPGLSEQAEPEAGCTGAACCETRNGDTGYCK
jgi:hypothetical protein